MSKQPKKYHLEINLWEMPRWINGNHSGNPDFEIKMNGVSRKDLDSQLKALTEYLPDTLPLRDSLGRFIKQEHDTRSLNNETPKSN